MVLAGFSFDGKIVLPAKTEMDECLELVEGTELVYEFKASLSVRFDLHTHVSDTDVLSLDSSYGTKKRGPTAVNIPRTGVYCFNWNNRYRDDVDLAYRFQIKEP